MPGGYASTGVASSRTGSTISHERSITSWRLNSSASPSIASVSNRSYGRHLLGRRMRGDELDLLADHHVARDLRPCAERDAHVRSQPEDDVVRMPRESARRTRRVAAASAPRAPPRRWRPASCPPGCRTARRPIARSPPAGAARRTSRPSSPAPRPSPRDTPRTARARRRRVAAGVIACSSRTRSVRNTSRSNPLGGSIATSASTWSRWFCTHVADRPDRLVERAALAHAEVLGHRDLHALDEVRDSTSARGTRSRTGSTRGSGPAPGPGSGRSGRSRPRGTRAATPRSARGRSRGRGRTASRPRRARPSHARTLEVLDHRLEQRSAGSRGSTAAARHRRAPLGAARTCPGSR